jgi:hypothetical protein
VNQRLATVQAIAAAGARPGRLQVYPLHVPNEELKNPMKTVCCLQPLSSPSLAHVRNLWLGTPSALEQQRNEHPTTRNVFLPEAQGLAMYVRVKSKHPCKPQPQRPTARGPFWGWSR